MKKTKKMKMRKKDKDFQVFHTSHPVEDTASLGTYLGKVGT
jgi:hypothetical protein